MTAFTVRIALYCKTNCMGYIPIYVRTVDPAAAKTVAVRDALELLSKRAAMSHTNRNDLYSWIFATAKPMDRYSQDMVIDPCVITHMIAEHVTEEDD